MHSLYIYTYIYIYINIYVNGKKFAKPFYLEMQASSSHAKEREWQGVPKRVTGDLPDAQLRNGSFPGSGGRPFPRTGRPN